MDAAWSAASWLLAPDRAPDIRTTLADRLREDLASEGSSLMSIKMSLLGNQLSRLAARSNAQRGGVRPAERCGIELSPHGLPKKVQAIRARQSTQSMCGKAPTMAVSG